MLSGMATISIPSRGIRFSTDSTFEELHQVMRTCTQTRQPEWISAMARAVMFLGDAKRIKSVPKKLERYCLAADATKRIVTSQFRSVVSPDLFSQCESVAKHCNDLLHVQAPALVKQMDQDFYEQIRSKPAQRSQIATAKKAEEAFRSLCDLALPTDTMRFCNQRLDYWSTQHAISMSPENEGGESVKPAKRVTTKKKAK